RGLWRLPESDQRNGLVGTNENSTDHALRQIHRRQPAANRRNSTAMLGCAELAARVASCI
ncbi:MAG: hypothetical protein QGI88_08110, partial [SAR202 cluster bacterium]|nr:hypothetical protein [SAR202 cluster bacterium]